MTGCGCRAISRANRCWPHSAISSRAGISARAFSTQASDTWSQESWPSGSQACHGGFHPGANYDAARDDASRLFLRSRARRRGWTALDLIYKGSIIRGTLCAIRENFAGRRAERMKEERRLVWRVLRYWKEMAHGGRFPRAATKSNPGCRAKTGQTYC